MLVPIRSKKHNTQHNANNRSARGEVWLVGAGAGSADLLTLRALKLIQQADVVIYDRLIADDILDFIKPTTERIYVGKACHSHSMKQADINKLMVDKALKGNNVCRLKGGDATLFARIGEELEALTNENIPFQIVPGITAASACSAYAGIPLTHRDYAQSVLFATAYSKDGEGDSLNWRLFAAPKQTVVFYMGLSQINDICKRLIAQGAEPFRPIAIVEKGASPDQQVTIASLTNPPGEQQLHKMQSPALLIVGDVVKLHDKFNWQFDWPQNKNEYPLSHIC